MLTQKQYKLLMFINKVCKETGCPPSFDEMKEAVGLKSKSGIHSMIESLVERNFLKKIPHKARALEVVRLPKLKPSSIIEEEHKREQAILNGMVPIPLYGKIAAGQPIEAIADETESIYVPFNMVSKGSHYALKVEGESMVGAGILDGDTVIISKCDCADEGNIVVALVDDNEATLKIFKRQGSDILLVPCNDEYPVQRYDASRVKIQGKFAGLIRMAK